MDWCQLVKAPANEWTWNQTGQNEPNRLISMTAWAFAAAMLCWRQQAVLRGFGSQKVWQAEVTILAKSGTELHRKTRGCRVIKRMLRGLPPAKKSTWADERKQTHPAHNWHNGKAPGNLAADVSPQQSAQSFPTAAFCEHVFLSGSQGAKENVCGWLMLETPQLARLQSPLIASAGSWVKAQVGLKCFTGFLCRGAWEHPGRFQRLRHSSHENALVIGSFIRSCRCQLPGSPVAAAGTRCSSYRPIVHRAEDNCRW